MKKATPFVILAIGVLIAGALILLSPAGAKKDSSQEQSLTQLNNQESESANTAPTPSEINNSMTLDDKKMDDQQVKELKIEDIKVGEGAEVKSGDTVVMHYKGTLLDGTKFDSSYDRGTPFETQIGVGRVIQGWDMGVPGMKVGGKRKLTIPSQLAYGEQGAGGAIPPNAALIFEVELLNIK